MARFAVGIFVLLLVLISFPIKAEEDPFQVVANVVKHQDQQTFEGIKIIAQEWERNFTIQVVHVLKDKEQERFEYFPFNHHVYQEAILNNHFVYYLKPSKNLILRSPLQPHEPKEEILLTLAAQNYTWEEKGIENVAGFETHWITATPKDEAKPVVAFWVDEKHQMILKEEHYDSDSGEPVFISYFSYLTFPKALPNVFFEVSPTLRIRDFPPPKKLEGSNALKALEFKPLIPRFIPKGFALAGTYLTQWHPHGKLQFLYSDGLQNFSVYEEMRHGFYRRLKDSHIILSNGHYVEFLNQPEGKLIRFAEGQLTIAVMGNLSQKALMEIALNTATPVAMLPANPLHRMAYYFARGLRTVKSLFDFSLN